MNIVMKMNLDNTDKNLLSIIQAELPLCPEPFAILGHRLGINSDEVIRRIERLKEEEIIRQVGPVFNPRRLGYQTTLVAMKVTAQRLDEASQIISAHPQVSHCYERDHDFNFWFTLAMSLKEDMESEVQELGSRIKAEATLNLPAVKVFKIGAYFNLGEGNSQLSLRALHSTVIASEAWQSQCLPPPRLPRHFVPRNDNKHSCPPEPHTGIEHDSPLNTGSKLFATDRAVINELQQDLPLIERPFDLISAKLSMNVDEFISHCQVLSQRGVMRRYSASINHNKIGFTANAMACWRVPPDMVNKVGKKVAIFPEVSHCYERQASHLWPYNLFAMIHAHTKDAGKAIAGKISAETGLDENESVLLFSTKEIKKVRIRYKV